ncbi:TetR family transcriptional regulator [Novosphingobium resinovorum]|uniref:TetR family transcriptional regulator n=1 Tax=Novosphingobium resinovorum TaxID=158500 RepID=A0A031JNE4_9SPHN|nr:TetR/AcrR family transcriptional regulator [Novosphingobium resinovorum]EZP79306.1 TetR family transcriptional regulator [Novosphingobium resinovorum]
MKTDEKATLSERLVSCGLEVIASNGLEHMSLRAVGSAAGSTTAGIVHHFGDKAGFVRALMEAGFQAERDWHAGMAQRIEGAELGHLDFAEWVAWYVDQRAGSTMGLFWSELLFKSRFAPRSQEAIARWHELRIRFWETVLAANGRRRDFAPYLVSYLCMEEVCAHALAGDIYYELFKRESLRTVTAVLFGHRSAADRSLSEWSDRRLPRYAMHAVIEGDTLPGRLIELAAKEVLEHGIRSLNQRVLAKKAGVSASMIIYHFGSMAAFENQAIWRAMAIGVPDATNPEADPANTSTLDKWAAMVGQTILPAKDERKAGFYCGYARMTGEVALLSRRKPELLPLIEHLRTLEGWASFGASQTIWKGVVNLTRNQAAAFAIWVKGQAIVNEIHSTEADDIEKRLKKFIREVL